MTGSRHLEEPREVPAEIKEAMADLAQLRQDDHPQMHEALFVSHVLPILTQPSDGKVNLTFWLDIAGTPLRGIDIIDANGEVLFHCPPLMRALPTVAQAEMNYYDIVSEAQLHENVHPAQAQRFLAEKLAKARHGATLIDVESAKQWNFIRKRYNLPLLLIGDAGTLANDEAGKVTPIGDGSLQINEDQDDF